MSRTQTDPSVLHYNSIASQYDQMLTSIPGDRWVRQAFQSFVPQTVIQPFPTRFFFGSTIGKVVRRTPSNWNNALPTAPAVGTKPISPTPLAP